MVTNRSINPEDVKSGTGTTHTQIVTIINTCSTGHKNPNVESKVQDVKCRTNTKTKDELQVTNQLDERAHSEEMASFSHSLYKGKIYYTHTHMHACAR